MSESAARLIIIEGPDGVGKTRVVNDLTQTLTTSGVSSIAVSFPGCEAGTLGKLVYELHHDLASGGLASIAPAALQTLHIAAHLDAIERTIKPALESGTTVVLDRFWWSTWVYGSVARIDAPILHHLIAAEKAAWGQHLPTAAILLDRHSSLRVEVNGEWQKIRNSYARLVEREAGNHPIHRIANEGKFSDTIEQICQILGVDPPS